jgi:hydroxypyruvate isomerase
MLRISANLGFLWSDLPLPEAVARAAAAGFDAVEFHWPYATPVEDVTAALTAAGMPLVSLNTRVSPGEFGLAAVPGAEARAREGIAEAVAYARAAGAGAVHVMAGLADGREAEAVFRRNVAWAVGQAGGLAVLIEPINRVDVPGYFLHDYGLAAEIAAETGARVMLDCYHATAMGQDPLAVFRAHGARVGHVQFADFPGRGAPGTGDARLERVLPAIRDAGYTGMFGAEYRPAGPVEDGLGWLAAMKAQ